MSDLSDCIAMSDDGLWYAFPYSMTRGQVIGILAEDSDWWDVLHTFTITGGHVRRTNEPGYPDGEWYEQCPADEIHAIPAWICRR